ncbi:MAG: redoxin domain-containing protein [Sphingomonas fennica]
MRSVIPFALAAAAAAPAFAATIGQPAPAFTATDATGRTVSLADFRGRPVVLEWNNPGCPFVQKHYGSGNMQRLQAAAKAQGAAWLTVNSGAPGKQGHMNGREALAFVAKEKAAPTAYLLDPTGKVGRLYAATATPGMAVIDATGRLVYQGAIDDKPTADPVDIKGARNHVAAALADLKAKRPVAVAQTRAYGCSVKYS